MPESLGGTQIRSILEKLGDMILQPGRLVLVGGGALALLGSPRLTIDLDFIGDDLSPDELARNILQAAKSLNIYAEPVPLDRFIPLPSGSAERTIFIGKFGNLEVLVADPYSIAFSKVDRGFDTDLEDILFLIRQGYIDLTGLERVVQESLPRCREFDINADDLRAHLETLIARLK
jgi:hypothetical protein